MPSTTELITLSECFKTDNSLYENHTINNVAKDLRSQIDGNNSLIESMKSDSTEWDISHIEHENKLLQGYFDLYQDYGLKLAIDASIDRYLSVMDRARKLYAKNGRLILTVGPRLQAYLKCERLAWEKYIASIPREVNQ